MKSEGMHVRNDLNALGLRVKGPDYIPANAWKRVG